MRVFTQKLWDDQQKKFRPGSFLIRAGRCQDFCWGESTGSEKSVDLSPFCVAPASIDLHVHSRGFREEHKESFDTLEAGALAGGVAVIACMANTQPRLDHVERIKEFLKLTRESPVEMIPFAAVTEALEGKKDTDWEKLLSLPVAGLSDDGKPILCEDRFVRALKITKRSKKLFSLHEEDLCISEKSILHKSAQSYRTGIPGSPSDSETRMVERDLSWSARLKAPIHLCHLSSGKSVDLIRQYRKKGAKVSAELTPHHGLLTLEDFPEGKATDWSQFKVCPVIREKSDRKALWAGLRSGDIDCFATDHAPHSRLEKALPMASAAHGILSLENHLGLYDQVRRQAKLSWGKFFRLSAERPAELLGLQKEYGKLLDNYWANFVVFEELSQPQPIDFKKSKSRNGPWANQKIQLKLRQTWIRGRCVYESN